MAQSIALNSSYTSQVVPPKREGEQSGSHNGETDSSQSKEARVHNKAEKSVPSDDNNSGTLSKLRNNLK